MLTIGLDLGDRSSFYCVLDGAGEVVLEAEVATNPDAVRKTFEMTPSSRIALETGTHSPGERPAHGVGTRSIYLETKGLLICNFKARLSSGLSEASLWESKREP